MLFLPAVTSNKEILCNRNWGIESRSGTRGLQGASPAPAASPPGRRRCGRCTQGCSAMASTGVCALCNMPDTDYFTGKLQKMPGKHIVAHKNCMLYSPGVISIESEEDIEGFEYNNQSVLNEIKRGKKLRCSHCKKIGATVGCDVKSCRKNYHFPCLIKAKGFPSKDDFVVYCELHKETDNDTEDSDGKTKKDMLTSKKKKRLQSTDGKKRKNKIKNQQNNEVVLNAHKNEQSERHFLLSVHPIETEEDNEEDLPPLSSLLMCADSCEQTGSRKSASKIKHLTCRMCETPLPNAYKYSRCPSCRPHSFPEQPIQDVITSEKDHLQSSLKEVTNSVSKKRTRNWRPLSTSSDTSSEESDSILTPKVSKTFSLSGFPKREKERSSQKNPNKEKAQKLEEILKKISSQEMNDLSQIYSEFGGSQPDTAIEMASPQENTNDIVTTEDPATTNVTDTPTSSENDEDKTPERLPDISVHASPPRSSTEEEHSTEEHSTEEDSTEDEAKPDKTSASFSKTENKKSEISKAMSILTPKPSDNKIKDSFCMNTPDASARIDIPEAQSPECPNGAVRPEVSPMATDIRVTAQQRHSTSSEGIISSQPTRCTDASSPVRPDTSVGYTLDLFSEQQSNNLEAQVTSETHPSGGPAGTDPGSGVSPPPTLKKDGNKTQVSPSNGLSPSQHLNRESPRLASPSNVTTWQNTEKGPNRGDISTVVSPKQIKAISREITKGNFAKQLKSIVTQLQSTIGSQKRNTTKDAEQRRDDQSISEGSPNSSTNNQPETTSPANDLPKPLENQERSDDPLEKDNLMCQERNKPITIKRKLAQDFEELPPHKKLQRNEVNLSEQPEISVEENENNFRENATSGSVESDRASEQQSGPSRMFTPCKCRTEGNVSEQKDISEEQHLSGPSSMATPFKRCFGSHRRSKKWSGYQHGRFGDLDDIDGFDGFGRAVAGQCRHLPHDRQARYMSYVLASADLFRNCPTLPELTVLITSLQVALETSRTSTTYSPSGSHE